MKTPMMTTTESPTVCVCVSLFVCVKSLLVMSGLVMHFYLKFYWRMCVFCACA